jgi:hypothetical protein
LLGPCREERYEIAFAWGEIEEVAEEWVACLSTMSDRNSRGVNEEVKGRRLHTLGTWYFLPSGAFASSEQVTSKNLIPKNAECESES